MAEEQMQQQNTEPSLLQRRRFGVRRLRVPLSNTQIVLIILLLAGGRLIYDFSQRVVEGQNMVEQQRSLEADLLALKQENFELRAAKIYYDSDAYVETWAHDDGKMVRDGEVLIVPLYQQPASQTFTPPQNSNNIERLSTQSIPTWQVWWLLFFDAPSPQLPAQ